MMRLLWVHLTAYPIPEALRRMDDRDRLLAHSLPQMIRYVRPQHHRLLRVSHALDCNGWWKRTWTPDGLCAEAVSSVTSSSSISVVSVPLDVTGDGPTMSLLGLIRWAECGLVKE